MTGIEIVGAVLIAGLLVGGFNTGLKDDATKAEACFLCFEFETSRESDIDAIGEAPLGIDDMTLPLTVPNE